MANILGWILFSLGVAHIAYGLKKFKAPLAAAFSDGFVGKFSEPEERKSAFWFMYFGPQIMLSGQVAVHAASTGDLWLLRLVGTYVFVTSIIGVAAFPKSPIIVALLLSPLLIAVGYNYL